ncbi:prepilin peptidase [Streptosporangium sp. NPDC000396]|uniref:prepilin peptidase n=1 Tax=Streptosporangium sp. NPDC000396 TaxID=3366185 RepID=UPI003678265B
MSHLPVIVALGGLVAGLWMRVLVVRHSVAEGEPLRCDCARCGAPLPSGRRLARVRPATAKPREPEVRIGLSPAAKSRELAKRIGPSPAAKRREPEVWIGPLSPAGRREPWTWIRALPAARCPGCHGRVGPPPLAVEIVTALALAALVLCAVPSTWPGAVTAGRWAGRAVEAGPTGELAAYGWLAVVAAALVFVDAAVHRLPDELTLAAYLGTAVLLTAAALLEGRFDDLVRAGLGGLALAFFYLVLFLINPAGMGLGDVKLAASLGTALGWLGWDVLVAGAFLGFLAGGLYGVVLMVLRRAGRKSEIPFGPFMVAGAFAAILTGL